MSGCPGVAHVHELDARNGRGGRWRVWVVVENGAYRTWTAYPSERLVVEYCQATKQITVHEKANK